MPAQTVSPDQYNRTLNDAIQSVYRMYGNNLAAFFRDVEDPVTHGNCKTELHAHVGESPKRDRNRAHAQR